MRDSCVYGKSFNKYRLRIFIVLLFGLVSSQAFADSIESIFSPGDISRPHAKFEKKCNTCHGKFEKGIQDRLCLDCHDHKNVASDIRQGKGFHGKVVKKGKTACKQCHREHRGRDAPIVLLNKGAFNHDYTDFRLKGAHTILECSTCHKRGKKYNQAPKTCYSCHKDDDAHKGKLGKKCENCHVESGWGKSGFNHDKETKFPLRGKHKDTDCQSCHPGNRFKKTPKKCVSCHGINDAHGGRYGKKCQTCHVSSDWKKIKFDHNRDTKYKLIGGHVKADCDRCHTGQLYKQEVKTECYACHRNDDEHKGRNGKKCKSCHTPKGWGQAQFDHDGKTEFPLRGKHKKANCESCHKGTVNDELDKKCYSCHKHSDVHKGKMSKNCNKCHNEAGWNTNVFFEHDITRFPLIGIHAVITCEECHQSSNYKEAEKDCFACHKNDDEHEGRFGDRCGICHNPNSWGTWLFDHNKKTTFKLDGAHEELACENCHKSKGGSIKVSKNCQSCHFADDIHRGGFGRRCERCHNTKDFSEVKIRR